MLAFLPSVKGQTGQIGTGTTTSSFIPIYSCSGYNYSQQLYTAAELTAAIGTTNTVITKIRFYVNATAATQANYNQWVVYMGNTTKTTFASTSDWVPANQMSQVYSGTLPTMASGTWVEITLDTPFAWNGTGNLVVGVDENAASTSCTASWGTYTSTTNTGMYYYNTTINPDPANPPVAISRVSAIPRLQLVSVAPYACMFPMNVNVGPVTAATAQVNWVAPTPAPANGYDVYYSTSPVAPNAGTVLNATNSVQSTTTSAIINGLAAQTTYYVWVRANCDAAGNVKSVWAAAPAFTTPCLPVSALPWTENFDAMTTLGSGIVPQCWTNVTGTVAWESSSAAASTTTPGPRSTANYMRIRYSNTNASQLWTPAFQLTAGTTYEFSFYYHTGGTTSSYIGYTGNVLVNNTTSTTGATTLGTFITSTQGTNSYTLYKVYYTPTTSGAYNFGVNVSSTSAPWYLGVDDFKLRVAPTCLDPQNFTLTAATTTSATVQWTVPSPAPANGYDVYYTTSATTPLATVTPQYPGVSGPSQLITGLTPSTTYYIWVRARCSATDIGDWTGPITLYTNYCIPTGGTSSTTYYLNNVNTTGGWTNLAYTASTYQAYTDTNSTVLTSPGNNITVNLASSSGTHYYYVWVDWNNDLDFNDAGETILATSSYAATATATIPVPAGLAYGTYRVRVAQSYIGAITNCGTAPYGSYVDFSLMVAAPPTCIPPQGLTLLSATTTSATVQWTVSTPAPANGYDVYYTTSTTAPTAATVPQYTGVAGPTQLISGLTPSTTYYIWVRKRCSSSDISYWSGPVKVYTNYCAPTGGTSSTNYYLKTITTTTGFTNLAYTATAYQAYVNNSATTFSVLPGNNINFSMNAGTSTFYYYIWIDWNNDMVFDPTTEQAYFSNGYINTATGTIASSTRPSGQYRARFAASYIGTMTPCGNAAYGNYVDFTFEIKPCATTAPTNQNMTNITHNSAQINWTQALNNLQYKVYWKRVTDTTWNSSIVLNPPTVNYVLTGLDPATKYEAKVVALCNSNEGTATSVLFTTRCDPTPPNVVVSNVTSTSATVTYNPIVPSATYVIRYRVVGTTTWINVTAPAPPANTVILTGLSSYVTYEVQVANICNGETTTNPWSNPQVFTTVRVCEIPPPGLTITQLAPTSAEVTWDAYTGTGATGNYVLRYRKVGIPSWTTVNVNTNTYTITGLLELTKYEMQVANVCTGTPGNFTPLYYFTTPTVTYCPMSSGSAASEYISKVTVTPISGTAMVNSSVGSTYTDYTANPLTYITLVQGSQGNVVKVDKTSASGSATGVAVWIDFNRNGYFDVNEKVLSDGPNTASTASAAFTVPTDAFVSLTDYKYVTMRVALQKGGVPVNCTSFNDGEVEDYQVRIVKQAVVNPLNQTDIMIYPNPVSSILNVKNVSVKTKYKIYSSAGQLISDGIILNNKIDVSKLINGLYVIELVDGDKTVQKKFIKE